MILRISILAALGLGIFLTAFAQSPNVEINDRPTDWAGTPDDYEDPWKEGDAVFPPPPSEENLTRLFNESLPQSHEYVIDRRSVSVQADKVFRYTIIIRTPTGSANGFFEGIHCETAQYKTYGFLTKGGFRETLSASWSPIPPAGLTIYRKVLFEEYVCGNQRSPADLETINARFDQNQRDGNRKIKVYKRGVDENRS